MLLTATPHNGKNEDFLAFMTLIDPERFTGRLRGGDGDRGNTSGGGGGNRGGGGSEGGGKGGSRGDGPAMPYVGDVMRRLVKENLRTFEGRRLFPKRHAQSLKFELSALEAELYGEVTEYVRNGMNRADRMREEGDKRRGIIIGFALAGLQRRLASSPAAIYHSLRRRRDRLGEQVVELRRLAADGGPVPVVDLPASVRQAQLQAVLEDFDFDDYDDLEQEHLENLMIDAATAAESADHLEAEVRELETLVRLADRVRRSGVDTKWTQLRGLLRSDRLTPGSPGSDRLTPSGPDNGGLTSGGPDSGGFTPGGSDGGGFDRDSRTDSRKLIVFSEYRDTLDYVADQIVDELGRPEAVVRIHGGVKRQDRRDIQERFRVDPTVRVLVATDAAGEGVNLQAANMMVNYDLPWNPNRIEQRFGRIHRIGQHRPLPPVESGSAPHP